MDRDDTLRRAERLLRQGRLEAAIEEYAQVVAAYPKDWATANLLGDLFIRAGRTDRAVTQYGRIAEQLAADGFLSKAAALYKKILKITPDDEQALLRTAELASQQGLPADARHLLHQLFQRRLKAGDRDGAARIARRLGAIDPNDVVGRLDAARMLAEIGDARGAADYLRLAGDTLAEQGREADALRAWRESMRLDPTNTTVLDRVTSGLVRQGDLDGALASARSIAERRVIGHAMVKAGRAEAGLAVLEQVLEAEPDHVDTRLQLVRLLFARQQYPKARDLLKLGLPSGDSRIGLALAEADLRTDRSEAAVIILRELLDKDPDRVDSVAALGASLTDERPDVAFVAVECALDHLIGRGELDWALKIAERFVAAAPRHVPALERFVQLCREGRYDDILYQAESDLVEAYLLHRQFAEALPIAQRLTVLRPDVDRHGAQVREALAGIDESAPWNRHQSARDDSTTEPIDLSGFTDSLGLPTHHDAETEADGVPPETEPETEPVPQPDAEPEPYPGPDREQDPEPEPDLDPEPEPARADEVIEIELADALDALAVQAPNDVLAEGIGPPDATSPAEGGSEGDLDDLFRRMRDESGRGQAEADAMRAYDEAGVHYNESRLDLAEACLRRAGRDPSLRFRASVMLARIATDRGQPGEAIAWFERASESPAPSVQAEASLLYELGVALERAGEPARAQAVFLTLSAMEPGYRDLAARLAALADRRASE